MLDIPFPLETVPASSADEALERMMRERIGTAPVLLGDADIFSAEWAEIVDRFEPPEDVLKAARALDTEAWFSLHASRMAAAQARAGVSLTLVNRIYRVASFPFELALFPIRLVRWPFTGHRPRLLSRSPFDFDAVAEGASEDYGIAMLRSQLAALEDAGEGTPEELDEIRQIIEEMEAEGAASLFPDPVAYVTPRHGVSVAAAMVHVDEPWEAAAWLQHGTYALCAPKPVLVAHCRWLWQTHGARIITASTDHIGFQMDRPIATPAEAAEVLARFAALGAVEVNADHRGTDGSSLVGAQRLWVWWD